jgi:ABC-2 type transport system permease protein
MRAVFCHELRGYFTTPIGYVFLAMYALLSGLVFVFINIGQEMSASMNLLFSGMQLPLMLITPLLTMRLFAEERRMRTDQLLLTAPVPLGSIVLGKALASMVMLLLAMLTTLLYPLLVSPYAQLSWSQIATVFLGYSLLNFSMLSIGVFLSSLCTNQITAAILTLGVNVLIYLSEHYIVPQTGSSASLHAVSVILNYLPSSSRLGDFANGIISFADVIYFLTLTALMLFLTDRVLEKRRHAKG